MAFVLYMKVKAPLNAVEQNLGCICLMLSTSDDPDNGICDIELKYPVVEVGELYEPESLYSITRSMHLGRSNSAVHPFSTELPWSHH